MSGSFVLSAEDLNLYSLFAQYMRKIQSIDESLCTIDKQIAESAGETAKLRQSRLDELAGKQRRVRVILNAAKSHISVPSLVETDPQLTEPYDVAALNQLLVTAELRPDDSSEAVILYRRATAQLNGLNLESARSDLGDSERTAQLKRDKHDLLEGKESELDNLIHQIESSRSSAQWESAVPRKLLGRVSVPVTLSKEHDLQLKKLFGCSILEKGFPFRLESNTSKGSCSYFAYNRETYPQIRNTVLTLMIEAARSHGSKLEQVLFADPFRWNNSELGILARPLADMGSIIEVPQNAVELKSALDRFLLRLRTQQTSGGDGFFICVLFGFPDEFDAGSNSIIREISYNAHRYNTLLILAGESDSTELPDLPYDAGVIRMNHGMLSMTIPECSVPGTVCLEAVPGMTAEAQSLFSRKEKKHDLDNQYLHRIPGEIVCRKGDRRLASLPYAVSDQGEVLKTSMEKTDAFGFVSGATGCGKSTLLHTLITSVMLCMHPDDVELWLVDFKMTEFVRYIDHTPPHIRYVMLERSPEMVYDLLDRLTGIYNGRNQRFTEHRWNSLTDAAKDNVYLPAIFVLIDEFSVMSHVLRGDVTRKTQLEELITKGRARGLHILFSSQNFENDLYGLTDTARDNIGWRAAMSGDGREKKGTLDLSDPGDYETRLINMLQPHYILVRRPPDSYGNRLDYGKVLYFPDEKEQLNLIDRIRGMYRAQDSVYEPDNTGVYVHKKPMFFDGYSYVSFASQIGEMQTDMESTYDPDDPRLCLYPGQPRRMRKVQSIDLRKNFGENLLIVGNPTQMNDMESLIRSLIESCKFSQQHHRVTILAGLRHPSIRAITRNLPEDTVIRDSAQQAGTIDEIYRCILNRSEGSRLLILLDYTELLQQFRNEPEAPVEEDPILKMTLTQLAQYPDYDSMTPEEKIQHHLPLQRPAEVTGSISSDNSVSIAEKLSTIIANGARYGYHVVAFIKAANELDALNINNALFLHRIFQRNSALLARPMVKTGEADNIEQMPDTTFRYSNDLDGVSYRPYLHEGMTIDGWCQKDGTVQRAAAKAEMLLE